MTVPSLTLTDASTPAPSADVLVVAARVARDAVEVLSGDRREELERQLREVGFSGGKDELVRLPGGGLVIDTPGMRELQLWDVGDAVGETFDDIEALARSCRFDDCRHRGEPQCAVRTAVEDGRLAGERLESYHKLQDEIAFLARQQDERALLDEKRRSKMVQRSFRQHLKTKRGS